MPEYEKTALVTGAASGIGLAAVSSLLAQGIRVIAVVRNEKRLKEALENCKDSKNIEFLQCDLSSQRAMRALAADIQSRYSTIDVLIHCAGVQKSHFMTSEDGIELQFAVNHLAPFILTHALLPCLKASKDARVLVISSMAHRHVRLDFNDIQLKKGYTGYKQYKRTKLMNALFAVEFNRRAKGLPIRAFAIDPGVVNTEFGAKGLIGLEGFFCRLFLKHGTSPKIPAKCIAHAALSQEILETDADYWKDCKPAEPDSYVYNEEAAKKLWELSERFGRTGAWKM